MTKVQTTLDRRSFCASSMWSLALGASSSLSFHTKASAQAGELQVQFDGELEKALSDPAQADSLRGDRESQIFFSPFAFGEERAPIRAKPSATTIATRATDLLLACEVTSKAKYIRSYQSPVWPKGKSGVTVGIGYDVGYVTKSWLKDDWTGYVSDDQIAALSIACGATGDRAQAICGDLQNVIVGWDAAYKQFLDKVQPRWVGETESSLPNCAKLNPNSLGALVSLVYNRGPSFNAKFDPVKDPIDRYREMRAIKTHMVNQEFERIPAELRSMTRIWSGDPDMRGLLIRRELEAVLFEAGLRQ